MRIKDTHWWTDHWASFGWGESKSDLLWFIRTAGGCSVNEYINGFPKEGELIAEYSSILIGKKLIYNGYSIHEDQ